MTDFELNRKRHAVKFAIYIQLHGPLVPLGDVFEIGWDACTEYLYPKVREALLVGSLADIEKRIGEVFGK